MPLPTGAHTLGEYAVHTAWEGFGSIVHQPSGEIMHSRTAPMEEARCVYVEQADLASRLNRPGEPLVLWDVGLGAAANAIAAIECFESNSRREPHRSMHVVSFENDLDSLRLATAAADKFPYLCREGPAELLRDGRWQSPEHPGLTWELVEGDFVTSIDRAPGPPEVIFYDMFSPKTCASAWRADTFRALFAACGTASSVLCTYTRSTASRAAMLAAGFWVAHGRSAGAKDETTIALTPSAARPSEYRFLGCVWMDKWDRSKARYPSDVVADEIATFDRLIRSHPQFQD